MQWVMLHPTKLSHTCAQALSQLSPLICPSAVSASLCSTAHPLESTHSLSPSV